MRTLFLSFFVFLGVLFGTFFAYQEWHDQFNQQEFTDVLEMSETSKIQKLFTPSGKTLVPEGAILGINEVDTILFTYLVDIDTEHTLDVSLDDVIFLKDNFEYKDLDSFLNVEITIENLNDSQALVFVQVSLNMPETQTQYDTICGSDVSLVLNFFRR